MFGRNVDNSESLKYLSEGAWDCVRRYLMMVSDKLVDDLREIWLYDSYTRGDIWGPNSLMHPDVDLLFLTAACQDDDIIVSLVNETYPFFLECGRQIAPQFKTCASFYEPDDKRLGDFRDRVLVKGKLLFGSGDSSL